MLYTHYVANNNMSLFQCHWLISAAITCLPLTSIVNGRINYFTDTTSPLDFNTVASHLCDTGYGIEGDVDRICSGDGSSPVGVWSSTATTCGGTYFKLSSMFQTVYSTHYT